ncbi:IS110 family transposase [Burkholderia territorii]|uniref:IS110 family transposase n=1 Tax=Burkholderia territorii TaxID=1503055 RepID=UPI001E645CDE|nr:IS110 family transposase [Burkholderia territorii]
MVESTYNWYWFIDRLQAAAFVVHLAHTTAIKKYSGLKHSGDETDARYLAHLLRLGILSTGSILPPATRNIRDLARRCMQLVRSRTTHILAVDNITARVRGTRLTKRQVQCLTAETVDQRGLPAEVTLAIQANVAVITSLTTQIQLIEARLAEKVQRHAEYALLTSVPGIGSILATTILLEIGSIERFASANNFASYARCIDSEHMSTGKKGEGNTKNGNQYLSWAFIEAANFAMNFCAEAKRFCERKKTRTNPIVARKTLAHKLAHACFHILKDHKPFDVTHCFP